MSKVSFSAHPFFVGFEQLDRLLERSAKSSSDGYPPFNIEQLSEHAYRITLAVAGFSLDELHIVQEDRQLLVRGKNEESNETRAFLHRGIANRQFQRSFVLADGVDVVSAELINGLLNIDLEQTRPDAVARKIEITSK
jgi:HSP20 family molecular chaperone IbpA